MLKPEPEANIAVTASAIPALRATLHGLGIDLDSQSNVELDIVAGTDCNGALSYDGVSQASKLTVATIVPEGVARLLLLAPALPFGARWWKRRRP